MLSEDECRTGINGLDVILSGGIPWKHTVLIEGTPGTGKTILALKFITNGILEDTDHPETGIFVCLDESPESIIHTANTFGWDLQSLIDVGQFILIDAYSCRLGFESDFEYAIPMGKFESKSVIDLIVNVCDQEKVKRLAVDSISTLLDGLTKEKRKETILKLAKLFSHYSLTSLLISELHDGKDAVERFASDGVISMSFEQKGRQISRVLRIVKMRDTPHHLHEVSYYIGKNGIEVDLM